MIASIIIGKELLQNFDQVQEYPSTTHNYFIPVIFRKQGLLNVKVHGISVQLTVAKFENL